MVHSGGGQRLATRLRRAFDRPARRPQPANYDSGNPARGHHTAIRQSGPDRKGRYEQARFVRLTAGEIGFGHTAW